MRDWSTIEQPVSNGSTSSDVNGDSSIEQKVPLTSQIESGLKSIPKGFLKMAQLPSKAAMEALDDPTQTAKNVYQGLRDYTVNKLEPATTYQGFSPFKIPGTGKRKPYTPKQPGAAATQLGELGIPAYLGGGLAGATKGIVGSVAAKAAPAAEKAINALVSPIAQEMAATTAYQGPYAQNLAASLGTRGVTHAATNIPSGSRNIRSGMGNFLLNRINKNQSERGVTPEQAQESMDTKYVGPSGQELPVDIGTLSNDPNSKSFYEALSKVPFSGVSKQMREVSVGQRDKRISDLNSQISDMKSLPDPNKSINSTYNNLGDHLKTGDSDIQEIKGNLTVLHKDASKEAGDIYTDIRKSNVNLLDKGEDPSHTLPNYNEAVNNMQSSSDTLNDIFGSSADIPSSLKKEIRSGKGILNIDTDESPLTVGNTVDRLQAIKAARRQAYSSNNGAAAQDLGSLHDALKKDLTNRLIGTPHEHLLHKLKNADDIWANRVIPLRHQDSNVKNLIFGKKFPSSGSIVNSIFNEGNRNIWDMMSPEAKNSSIRLKMNKDKHVIGLGGTPSSEDIASASDSNSGFLKALAGGNYMTGYDKEKNAPIIESKPGSHPLLSSHLAKLSDDLETHKENQKSIQDKQKEIDALKKPSKDAQPQKANMNDLVKMGGFAGALLAGIHHPGIMAEVAKTVGGATGAARYAKSILTDKNLRDAYLKGEKMSYHPSFDTGNIFKNYQRMAAISAAQQQGNQ